MSIIGSTIEVISIANAVQQSGAASSDVTFLYGEDSNGVGIGLTAPRDLDRVRSVDVGVTWCHHDGQVWIAEDVSLSRRFFEWPSNDPPIAGEVRIADLEPGTEWVETEQAGRRRRRPPIGGVLPFVRWSHQRPETVVRIRVDQRSKHRSMT